MYATELEPEDFLDVYLANNGVPPVNFISLLPDELIVQICMNLPFATAVQSVGLLNKDFYRITGAQDLWKIFYLRSFQFLVEKDPTISWCEHFKTRWSKQVHLQQSFLRSITLNDVSGSFDMMCSNGSFVAAHDEGEILAGDLIQIWDLDRVKLKTISPNIESHPSCIIANGSLLIVGMVNGEIHFFNFKTLNLIRSIIPPKSNPWGAITSLAIDQTRGIFGVGSKDGRISLWDQKSCIGDAICCRTKIQNFWITPLYFVVTSGSGIFVFELFSFKKVFENLISIQFSSIDKEERFIYYSDGTLIHILDLNALTEIIELPPTDKEVLKEVLVSCNKLILLSTYHFFKDNPSNLYFINKETKEIVKPVLNASIVSMAIFEDFFLVTGTTKSQICLWDINGNLLRCIRTPEVFQEIIVVPSGILGKTFHKIYFLEWIKPREKQIYGLTNQQHFETEKIKEITEEEENNLKRKNIYTKDKMKIKKQKLENFWK